MKYCAIFSTLLAVFWHSSALGQILEPGVANNIPITDQGDHGGEGWGQIYNTDELRAFVIDVLVALSLAAAIALHPVRRAARSSKSDFIMPRLFAFYALVGMVVGFLVDQHGYIIGFVIFGIGALLRFRSNLDDPVDTVEMIFVTVLGLCVGLNLPVMAISIGIIGWVLIWIAGRRIPIELRLQADSAESLQSGVQQIRQVIEHQGWQEAFLHRSHTKNSARMVLLHSASVTEEGIEAALLETLDGTELNWKLGD